MVLKISVTVSEREDLERFPEEVSDFVFREERLCVN